MQTPAPKKRVRESGREREWILTLSRTRVFPSVLHEPKNRNERNNKNRNEKTSSCFIVCVCVCVCCRSLSAGEFGGELGRMGSGLSCCRRCSSSSSSPLPSRRGRPSALSQRFASDEAYKPFVGISPPVVSPTVDPSVVRFGVSPSSVPSVPSVPGRGPPLPSSSFSSSSPSSMLAAVPPRYAEEEEEERRRSMSPNETSPTDSVEQSFPLVESLFDENGWVVFFFLLFSFSFSSFSLFLFFFFFSFLFFFCVW